jgi:hypothetical protein
VALSATNRVANELLLMKGRLIMKRMAIVWFVESLFGSQRKRPDWTLLMIFAGLAIALLLLLAR